MKKIIYTLLCLSLAAAMSISCGKENGGGDETNDEFISLTINVNYGKDGQTIPDVGSIVYIYENFLSSESEWVYQRDGIFYRSNQEPNEKKYSQKAIADATGKAFFSKVLNKRNCTIIVEPTSSPDIYWRKGTVISPDRPVINYTVGQPNE